MSAVRPACGGMPSESVGEPRPRRARTRAFTVLAWLTVASLAVAMGCAESELAQLVLAHLPERVPATPQNDKLARTAMRLGKAGLRYARSHQEISPQQEYSLGRTVAARLLSQLPLDPDPELFEYLNRVGRTLAQASDRPQVYGGYHFGLMASDEVTAFTCPAGFILVSRGAVAFARSEDELAAIVAHELAHAALKHPLQAIRDVSSIPILSAEELLAASSDSPRLRELTERYATSTDDIYEAIRKSGYKKHYEFEADALAVTLLARTGYDPTALARVLSRLPARRGFSATHPPASRRLERLARVPGAIAPERRSPDSLAMVNRTRRFLRLTRGG